MLNIAINFLTNPRVRTLSAPARALLVDLGVAAANGGLGKLPSTFNDLDRLSNMLWPVFGMGYEEKSLFEQWLNELSEEGFVSFDPKTREIFLNWDQLDGFRPKDVWKTTTAADLTPGGLMPKPVSHTSYDDGPFQGMGRKSEPDKAIAGPALDSMLDRVKREVPLTVFAQGKGGPYPAEIMEHVKWDTRVRAWQLNPATWRGSEWGPEPNQSGTRVPKDVFDPS